MIISRISCGLGNQLFQYAIGRRLALLNNTELKLDISSYENDSLRQYMMGNFNIAAGTASAQEIEKFKSSRPSGRRDILLDTLERLGLYHRPVLIKERESDLRFDPTVLRKVKDAYLEGWWPTEKYFVDIQDVIRSEFTPRAPLGKSSIEVMAEIEASGSISLHVRRGDKASDADTNHWHGTCSLDYYREAAAYIAARVSAPHFFVFSDDPEWAMQNIRLEWPLTFVTHNQKDGNDYEDLHLLSRCRHHIIANSTFSWWGAWLCDNPQKIVFAPKRWFNNLSLDISDLYPSDWHQI